MYQLVKRAVPEWLLLVLLGKAVGTIFFLS